MDTKFEKKEIIETTPKESTENLSTRGISSIQGVETNNPQPDTGKTEAGKVPAETPPKVNTKTTPDSQPTPMIGENLEKGTADRIETGHEKERDFVPAYQHGGPERGG
jgi:hypothetical protein